MTTNKTQTNGYYKLPNDKFLHFSMNTWYNLKEDTGEDLSAYSLKLQEGTEMDKAFALADIIHAAAKAFDQEEGNDIDYNKYTVRGWFGDIIGPDEIVGITKALLWNNDSGEAKDTGKK